jgi:hypothetical protein
VPVTSQLKQIGDILASLSRFGRAVDPQHSEELQLVPTTFDLSGTAEPLWPEEASENTTFGQDKINFRAFIDGVQRSSVIYWVTLDKLGALVPVILSHIASGVTIRNEDKKLKTDHRHVHDNLLLLLPLRGMIEAGFQGGNIIQGWVDKGMVIPETKISEDPIVGLGFNGQIKPLILCDTTFNNIERNSEAENDLIREAYDKEDSHPELINRLLMDKNLFNISKVRGRAQGRVNTIRQILEMIVLSKFREAYGNQNYVLVDGPLFFLGKWLRKYEILKNKTNFEREEFVLKNAVGMVKTLKGRPKRIEDLRDILYLKEGTYSRTMSIHDAVDIQTEHESPNSLEKPHVTSFLRFRYPPDIKLPNILGLTRIDLHLTTIGANTLDEATSDMDATKNAVQRVMSGVLRERWPGISQKGRTFNEAFPISETERMLRARLYSTLEMNYIYSMIRA